MLITQRKKKPRTFYYYYYNLFIWTYITLFHHWFVLDLSFHIVSCPYLWLSVFKSQKHIQKWSKIQRNILAQPKKIENKKWFVCWQWECHFYLNLDLISLSKICGLKKNSFSCDWETRKCKPLSFTLENLLTTVLQSANPAIGGA